VLKTKGQVRRDSQLIASSLSIRQLYASYFLNLLYALPADIIKFLAYEYITFEVFHKEAKLQGGEAALAGALASLVAQFLTTPLDVVRTRAMISSDDGPNMNLLQRMQQIAAEEGWQNLFLGIYPRLVRAVMSGAIQFASYELARNALT
jgi:solute carrier family 25 S-adenosylmethionine transporter 26